MKKGIVKFFNEAKGYGFIKDDESGEDVFMHVTGLANRNNLPKEGDKVSFNETESKKGLCATDVKIL